MAIVLTTNSCIYEFPDDEFFRTLWESDDTSAYPDEMDSITLEFLCSNAICMKQHNSTIGYYGTYDSNGKTAIFQDLTMVIGTKTIIFTDAYRSGETLELRWHTSNSSEIKSIFMHRLSEYK